MCTDNYIKIIAGIMIVTTSLLGLLHHEYWIFATIFIGANLFQFGITGFCPLESILKKFGIKPCNN